ncbi:hypothetical protein HELRODRAFT_161288 [Helobdella robusta]|uniref:Uncharacterized protein n=1 Tax=Helobdella robusta TaxID=6412 RepID=T1ERA7_HELRO|nr:hypothetical protein HELRODRAFT_161288 [Helobdella robusta]ESO02061.1 hypothetical protein HELRODRAFT_161288 [Helobdella robusta]
MWIGYIGDNSTSFYVEYNKRQADYSRNDSSVDFLQCHSDLPSIFKCGYNSSSVNLYDYQMNLFLKHENRELHLKNISCHYNVKEIAFDCLNFFPVVFRVILLVVFSLKG